MVFHVPLHFPECFIKHKLPFSTNIHKIESDQNLKKMLGRIALQKQFTEFQL